MAGSVRLAVACCCISGADDRNRSSQAAECSGLFVIRKPLSVTLGKSRSRSRGKSWRIARAALEVDERRGDPEFVKPGQILAEDSENGSVALEVSDNGTAMSPASEEVDVELLEPGTDPFESKGPPSISVQPTEASSDRFVIRNNRMVFQERVFLIGVDVKGKSNKLFSVQESLEELAQLADTAGLLVVGSTYQKLARPSPRTYIAAGKVQEVKTAIEALDVETVIFDDEISPGQARNLEKAFGGNVRVCDRTALIIDIFSQRAATSEAALQVELAQLEYQLPRLTKLWTHLERQAGGMVKGMGEKQIEVDKRLLRIKIGEVKKSLDTVRQHRQHYRNRRTSVPIPVLSLVGYTNAGKSTLLNRLSNAGVLAEDKLFATLDPITKRVQLPHGKECLFTDTVGFIQKLPTQLVAAFRATLEEITDSSLILHVVDISHPMVVEQTKAVNDVLADLDVQHIPRITVWNKIDRIKVPDALKIKAKEQGAICVSALTGEGMDEFLSAVEDKVKEMLVQVEAVLPYDKGDLVDVIHRHGVVEQEEYTPSGTRIKAHVPLSLSKQLLHYRQQFFQDKYAQPSL